MATQIFNNEQELKTYFDSIMQQVIEAVSSDLLKDFYNTFKFSTGETAFDIIKMSDFRKTFRYIKIIKIG